MKPQKSYVQDTLDALLFCRQKRSRSKGEEDERTKSRDNISYAQEDDEAVFKKPKTKVSDKKVDFT